MFLIMENEFVFFVNVECYVRITRDVFLKVEFLIVLNRRLFIRD